MRKKDEHTQLIIIIITFVLLLSESESGINKTIGKRSVLCMHGTQLILSSKTLTFFFFRFSSFLYAPASQLLSITDSLLYVCLCIFGTHINRTKTAVQLFFGGK